MPREEEPWQDHLDSATHSISAEVEVSSAAVPGLTVLAHPDSARVGERAVLTDLLAGKAVELSRLAPDFALPRGGVPRPLADPRLSRRPWRLSPGRAGRLLFDAGESRTAVEVEGSALTGIRHFERDELDHGVVLLLARRVVLLLHLMESAAPVSGDFGLVGESAAVNRLKRDIRRVADRPFPVLLRGESGTGKEVVARAVHEAGSRRGKPYLAVNMASIPPTLAAAELFGVVKGAYSGADRQRRGHFQRAAGGTLFLDEIAAAPSDVQALLLRVLEDGRIQAVGSEAVQAVDVRIISATDADLEEAVHTSEFRSPLLHRLSSYEITLPPLRARRDDFGRLFFYFLRRELEEIGEEWRLTEASTAARPYVPAPLVARLVAFDWPGNVRQLRNVVRQLVTGNRGHDEILPVPQVERLLSAFPLDPPKGTVFPRGDSRGGETESPPQRASYRDPDSVSEDEVRAALSALSWEVKPAAAELNVSRSTLYELMRSFGIRRAQDLSCDEIVTCRETCGGDVVVMAQRLEVSKRGLKMRMTELGLR